MAGALDLFFTPLRLLAAWLLTHRQGHAISQAEAVGLLFVCSSLAAAFVFILLGGLLYLLAVQAELTSERLYQLVARGQSLERQQALARQYVFYCRAFGLVRRYSGVGIGYPSPPDTPTVGDRTPAPARAVLHVALIGPYALTRVLRVALLWLGTPVGAYMAAGSLWVGLGLRTLPGETQLVARAHSAVTPEGVAVIALVVAAGALLLDHGLTARLRARNEFLKAEGAEAERILREVQLDSVDMIHSLDDALRNVAPRMPWFLESVVDDAGDGRWRLVEGRVRELSVADSPALGKLARRRPRHPSWSAERPLENSLLAGRGGWLPIRRVDELFKEMSSLTADPRLRAAVGHQAPRRARRYLSEITLRAWRGPSGATLEAREAGHLPADLIFLEQEVAERRLLQLRDQIERASDSARVQRLIDAAVRSHQHDLWRAMVLRAHAEEYVQAVSAHQHPRGPLKRLLSRLAS